MKYFQKNMILMMSLKNLLVLSLTFLFIHCSESDYQTVGGKVTGLDGTVVLQNNSTDDLTIKKNGKFTFADPLLFTAPYKVTVKKQPSHQTCVVTNGNGTAEKAITNVVVHCSTSSTTPSTTSATLTVTPSTLTLSMIGLTTTTGNNSGTPRVFTIENTGPDTATGIVCPTSGSISINSIACNGCEDLANGDTCTVTITPSGTPSAAVADTNPTPITLTLEGDNTNTLNPTVNVLTYGSFYQAGFLFSIIETANTSLSIGGTVAAESDNAAQNSTLYSLGGADTTTAMYSGTDGSANTGAMVAQYGAGTYSATVCTTSTGGGYADWYLPAICQMGFGGSDQNFNCGTSPGIIPNIQYNLLIRNNPQDFNFVTGPYWSSTASEDSAPTLAWLQLFAVGGNDGAQFLGTVVDTLGVRCVRDLE